ncbi:hypothetical protein TNCV_278091 [Trichonephila clavipes]|nr:hypothetical protein TNCV_278091 [Trichonephila clavipes]
MIAFSCEAFLPACNQLEETLLAKLTSLRFKTIITQPRAVGSLVVRASDSRPDGRCHQISQRIFGGIGHPLTVLVKLVGPKVLWVVAAKTTATGGWKIFPSPTVPCLNCGGGDRWCRHLS